MKACKCWAESVVFGVLKVIWGSLGIGLQLLCCVVCDRALLWCTSLLFRSKLLKTSLICFAVNAANWYCCPGTWFLCCTVGVDLMQWCGTTTYFLSPLPCKARAPLHSVFLGGSTLRPSIHTCLCTRMLRSQRLLVSNHCVAKQGSCFGSVGLATRPVCSWTPVYSEARLPASFVLLPLYRESSSTPWKVSSGGSKRRTSCWALVAPILWVLQYLVVFRAYDQNNLWKQTI